MIDSASVLISKWDIAPRGTALLFAELVAPADVAPLLEVLVTVLAASAFTGGFSVFADGVYSAEVVNAFDPADDEPFPVEDAGAPDVPAAAFD